MKLGKNLLQKASLDAIDRICYDIINCVILNFHHLLRPSPFKL